MARRIKNNTKADDTLVDIVNVRDTTADFVEQNKNLLIGGGIALLLLAAGAFYYFKIYKVERQAEAVEQMYQAQIQFERDSFAVALTNPGGGYSGLLDIIDNYKGTSAANLALYYAGISYLNLGKFDAAIDYLEDFSPSGEISPVMKNGALGDAYSELNDMSKALSYYKKAANGSDNEVLAGYYLKKLGMLYEREGNLKEAKATYERLKAEFPLSPYATDVEKYITRVAQ